MTDQGPNASTEVNVADVDVADIEFLSRHVGTSGIARKRMNASTRWCSPRY